MISRKIKLLSAVVFLAVVVGAGVLIATVGFARTEHKAMATAGQAHEQQSRAREQQNGADVVYGPDGELIGAARDSSIRVLMQQDGLPE